LLRLRPANGTAAVGEAAVPGRPWWGRFGRSGFGAVFGRVRSDPLAVAAGVVLLVFLFIAVFGPLLAPYDPTERTRTATGELAYLQSPSSEHLLGTTNLAATSSVRSSSARGRP
jgi:ABC-type dipeptide/oligopeptide/nickel transport system permease subunit